MSKYYNPKKNIGILSSEMDAIAKELGTDVNNVFCGYLRQEINAINKGKLV